MSGRDALLGVVKVTKSWRVGAREAFPFSYTLSTIYRRHGL